ncbi:MAG: insulinase family protein [Planctomycetes bacterium]|nr:insulinase family protein [Planctomycetota bacterium]
MRQLLALVSLLVVAATASAQQVDVQEFTLPNGMKFLLVPRTDQPNVISAGWLAKVGSVNERPGITGISHFFEHMMFKGTNTIGTRDPQKDAEYRAQQKALRGQINNQVWTTQYTRFFKGEIDDPWNPSNDTTELKDLRAQLKKSMDQQQGRSSADAISKLKKDLAALPKTDEGKKQTEEIQKQIAKLELEQTAQSSIVKDEFDQVYTKAGGSGMNAFTSYDITFFFINVPSNKFELWAWMESDRLMDSVFREFYSERDVVHEERRLRTESTPTGRFQEQFEAMFWISSNYLWPVIGWTSDLNSYTMDGAMEYWNTYYRPNNLVGVVVGDFKPEEVKAKIEQYFGRLEPGKIQPPPVVTLETKQMAEQRMNAEGDFQPEVEVRYHTVPLGHKDGYALDMMSEVLNGRTGRLYKGMIEGRSIASSASANYDGRKYAGAFSFDAETKGDSTPEQLEQAWYDELKKLQDELVPDLELQKVKNGVAANSYRRLQNNFSLLVQLGFAESTVGWRELNELPKKLQAVTAADIQRVAKTYFDVSNRSVATYKRKAGAAAAGDDPDLASLPAPMRARAKQMASQLTQETDPENLRKGLEAMEAQSAQVPPQMKPMFDYMKKKINDRIAQLEAGGAPAAAKDAPAAPAAGKTPPPAAPPTKGAPPAKSKTPAAGTPKSGGQ